MCGIVYSMSFTGKPVMSTVIGRYKAQRNRGREGFGYYIPEKNRLTHNTREGRILSLLKRETASEVLFHHRFPTSTENVRNACHPFSTKDHYEHNYVGVHNGVLHNEHILEKAHRAQGIKYTSMQENGKFNDSEALIHDIAQYIEGKTNKLTAEGSIAFIMVQMDKEGKRKALYFGRNAGNPLVMKFTKNSVTLSSQGEGVMIDTDILYRWDYEKQELTHEDLYIPEWNWTNNSYTYGGYSRGYVYDPESEEDEEIRMLNAAYAIYNEEDEYIQSMVKDKAESLKYDCYENVVDAIELAQDEIFSLRRKNSLLDAKSIAEDITDEELNTYCENAEYIELLNEVVKYLQKEAAGTTQSGFPYSDNELAERLAVC